MVDAEAGEAAQAVLAEVARDVERHHHAVADLEGRHIGADLLDQAHVLAANTMPASVANRAPSVGRSEQPAPNTAGRVGRAACRLVTVRAVGEWSDIAPHARITAPVCRRAGTNTALGWARTSRLQKLHTFLPHPRFHEENRAGGADVFEGIGPQGHGFRTAGAACEEFVGIPCAAFGWCGRAGRVRGPGGWPGCRRTCLHLAPSGSRNVRIAFSERVDDRCRLAWSRALPSFSNAQPIPAGGFCGTFQNDEGKRSHA